MELTSVLPTHWAVWKTYRPLFPMQVIALDLLGIGAAFGGLMGTDATTGGYVVGGIVTIALMLALSFVLGEELAGYGIMIPGALGVILAVLFGWWPTWTVIFVSVPILFIATGILKDREA